MDQNTAEAAAAIQKYEDAITCLLTYVRSGRWDQFDFDLRTQLHEASIKVGQYRGTLAYRDAVFRADSRAGQLAR